MNIEGNVLADLAATRTSSAARSDPFQYNRLTIPDYRREIKTFLKQKNLMIWRSLVLNKLRIIYPNNEYIPSWKICKKDQMIINRLRAGHSYFTHSYLISNEEKPKCENCDADNSIQHIFECEEVDAYRSYYSITGSIDWKKDLFNQDKFEGIKKFLEIKTMIDIKIIRCIR